MPNKLYSDLTSGYFVSGAGKNGYMKKGKGWQNVSGSTPNNDWSEDSKSDQGLDTKNWFGGKGGRERPGGYTPKDNYRFKDKPIYKDHV